MTISQITWAPLVLTIAVLAGGLASADEHEHEHRQHGRHEHGVGH